MAWKAACDPLPSFDLFRAMSAMQREEPVTVGARTHGDSHQADLQFGGRCRHDRQQSDGQQPPAHPLVGTD